MPFGDEIPVTLVPGFLAFGAVQLALVYAVIADAAARGSRVPTLRGISTVILAPLLVLYLLSYRRRHDRTEPVDGREQIARTVAIGGVLATAVTALVTPPDPFSQLVTFPLVLAGSLPIASLFVYREVRERLSRSVP
jgi:hypothetical protein